MHAAILHYVQEPFHCMSIEIATTELILLFRSARITTSMYRLQLLFKKSNKIIFIRPRLLELGKDLGRYSIYILRWEIFQYLLSIYRIIELAFIRLRSLHYDMEQPSLLLCSILRLSSNMSCSLLAVFQMLGHFSLLELSVAKATYALRGSSYGLCCHTPFSQLY